MLWTPLMLERRSMWAVDGARFRDRGRARPRRSRRIPLRSAWDRAVADFAAAWQLSPADRTRLHLQLRRPADRLEAGVRELVAEAGALAHESGRYDLAAWCYAVCEQVTLDPNLRPTWEEIALDRPRLEALLPAVRHAETPESALWWCVRQLPQSGEETVEAAARRRTTCALYVASVALRAFATGDPALHAQVGVLSTLGTIVARRSRSLAATA